jgi:hypothetical protein
MSTPQYESSLEVNQLHCKVLTIFLENLPKILLCFIFYLNDLSKLFQTENSKENHFLGNFKLNNLQKPIICAAHESNVF